MWSVQIDMWGVCRSKGLACGGERGREGGREKERGG